MTVAYGRCLNRLNLLYKWQRNNYFRTDFYDWILYLLSFFKLLPEFKNVKPWAGFYTPGLYLELFDTLALYFGIIPWAYTAFFIVAVNCCLQALSPGLSNGLINGGVYIRGSLLPEWKQKTFRTFRNEL